jgi:hypothetical protein
VEHIIFILLPKQEKKMGATKLPKLRILNINHQGAENFTANVQFGTQLPS